MVFGYIRVSTDKQTVENQRYEINNFALKNNIVIDRWIEETVSGNVPPKNRLLGKKIKRMNSGDKIIATEISRLGRNLLMIMAILNNAMEKNIHIQTIKDNFTLGDDITSKVLAFAFGIAAEIERKLISQRTIEALARKKAQGVVLGRPKGSKSSKTKLTGKEDLIKKLIDQGYSYNKIASRLKVHRTTLSSFIINNNI